MQTLLDFPNPKNHLIASLIKSAFRIGAGVTLATGFLTTAGILFVVAEVIGIVEELV